MKVLVCVVDLKHWWRFFTLTFEHVVLETPEIVVSQPELGYHGKIRERADLYLRDEIAMETDEGQGRHAPEVGVADDIQVVVVEVDSNGASRDVSRAPEILHNRRWVRSVGVSRLIPAHWYSWGSKPQCCNVKAKTLQCPLWR